jgi:hypothetical protein
MFRQGEWKCQAGFFFGQDFTSGMMWVNSFQREELKHVREGLWNYPTSGD